ncbi:hypothetical protein CcI49_08290 [Frankia sp. CcI49]|uniref:hypothetical protein n=1 Tax=unclassified Frankia TaxID=2632575 RepID=UPI0006CA1C4D|nr:MULTISPECIES: hypothetical protein [unclassified Frankia]KPM54896.1 hypothetical protein ACG83_16015 [Frankia sp. R43]ONH61097.1 hypothetical protein CcI49_08290 [Frankia sp. CcI49]
MNASAGQHRDSNGPGGTAASGDGHEQVPPGGMFGLRVLPAGWMRVLVVTVTVLVTLVIAMGDLASAWVLLVLPLAVAALVAYAEVLERALDRDG